MSSPGAPRADQGPAVGRGVPRLARAAYSRLRAAAGRTGPTDGARPRPPEPSPPAPLCTARELLIAVAFVAVLTLIFFAPLLSGKTLSNVPDFQRFVAPWQGSGKGLTNAQSLHVQHRVFVYPQGDQATFVYPNTVLLTRSWRSGAAPLWNPYNFGGIPVLGNGSSGVVYPVRIVLAALVSPSVNHDLFLVLHVFLSGLFMFLLMKELRLRLPAALLGAAAWMFASFGTSWMEIEAFMPALTWFPAALLLIHRGAATRSWRTATVAGVPLALMAVGGNVQSAALAFAVCGVYSVALALQPPGRVGLRPVDWRRLSHPILTMMVGAGLGAVMLLPTVQNAGPGGRQAASYDVFVRKNTVSIGEFRHVFSGGPPFVMTLFRAGVFVGLVPLLLAFVGFARRRPGSALGRWLSIGTMLFATGTPVVAWLAYTFIPGVSRLTTTGYTLWLFDFGVVVLAALGLDAVLGWPARLATRLRRPDLDWARLVPVATALVALLALGGTAWQLVRYARYINPPFTARQADNLYPTTPAIRAIQHDHAQRAATDPQRLLGFTALYGDQSLVFSLEDADGYDAIVPNRVRSLWRAVEGGTSIDAALNGGSAGSFLTLFDPATTRYSMLPRVGVTTIVSRPAEAARIPDARATAPVQLVPVYTGRDASVLNIAGTPPRAWVVHEADVVGGQSAALHRFADPAFDYRARMLVEPDQGLGSAGHHLRRGSGPGAVARRDDLTVNGTSFTVDSPTSGWLVMADIYAPGWDVTVNGHSATLLRANYTFRAVAVPAGRSRVQLRYQPPGLTLGVGAAGVSLAALVSLATIWLWSRRRTRLTGR